MPTPCTASGGAVHTCRACDFALGLSQRAVMVQVEDISLRRDVSMPRLMARKAHAHMLVGPGASRKVATLPVN